MILTHVIPWSKICAPFHQTVLWCIVATSFEDSYNSILAFPVQWCRYLHVCKPQVEQCAMEYLVYQGCGSCKAFISLLGGQMCGLGSVAWIIWKCIMFPWDWTSPSLNELHHFVKALSCLWFEHLIKILVLKLPKSSKQQIGQNFIPFVWYLWCHSLMESLLWILRNLDKQVEWYWQWSHNQNKSPAYDTRDKIYNVASCCTESDKPPATRRIWNKII